MTGPAAYGSLQREWSIRLALPDDAAAIAAILRDVGWFDHVNREEPERSEARVRRGLEACEGDESQTVLVATVDRRVVGYATVHWFPNLLIGPEGYLSELFILEMYRSVGIGSGMLAAIEDEARERGCTRLMLFNRRVRESYTRGFYQRNGWVERDDVALMMRDPAGPTLP
jgi:GNAT superfamily N-acetyltransferase